MWLNGSRPRSAEHDHEQLFLSVPDLLCPDLSLFERFNAICRSYFGEEVRGRAPRPAAAARCSAAARGAGHRRAAVGFEITGWRPATAQAPARRGTRWASRSPHPAEQPNRGPGAEARATMAGPGRAVAAGAARRSATTRRRRRWWPAPTLSRRGKVKVELAPAGGRARRESTRAIGRDPPHRARPRYDGHHRGHSGEQRQPGEDARCRPRATPVDDVLRGRRGVGVAAQRKEVARSWMRRPPGEEHARGQDHDP